jgi:hypothetical protein
MHRFGFLFAIALTCIAVSNSAIADTVSLQSVADNTLYESATGHLSNGAGIHFLAGVNGFGDRRRGLLRFNIADVVPVGSIITNVSLRLHMSRTAAASEPVALHRVLTSWNEGPTNAPGQEGSGGIVQPGDATWLHTHYSDQFWGAPGGDFDPDPSSVIPIIGIGFYTWNSTPQLVSNIQNWLDQPLTNHGWILLGNESSDATAKRFDSREIADSAARPVLTIQYIPEPATSIMTGLGSILLLSRNRKRLRQ